jgi:hypothetical protein
VDVERRIVLARADEEVLGQAQLVLAEDVVGDREQLLRPLVALERRVALAADRESSGCTPAASTACTACSPGISLGMATR